MKTVIHKDKQFPTPRPPFRHKALLLLTALLLTTVVAQAQIFTVGNFRYDVIQGGNTVSVSAANTNIRGDITIPSSVTNGKTYTVTNIPFNAFNGCSRLTSVTIPNSVTSIGWRAFDGCSGLTSVTIPNSVTSIGDNAFNGCGSLASVTIPNGVTVLEISTFSGCSSLTSITIPSSVTSIGQSAFNGCSGLTSVTIPGSVTDIAYLAFYNCSSLSSITLPSSITSIGNQAFSGCSSLTSVTIPENVTSIGTNVFYGCTALHTVEAKMIQPPHIYSSVVFYSDLSKVKLIVPGGMVGIYQRAGWGDFGTIEMDANTPTRFVINDYGTLTTYTGPGGSVTIPDEVKGIAEYVFYNNTSLTSVSIPISVTSIGNRAFSGCTALRTVEAKMVKPPSISLSSAFDLTDLSNVKLIVPGGTVEAYKRAGWSGFGTIEMDTNTPTRFVIDDSGVLTVYTGPGGDIVIPNEVKSIANYVFYNNTSITSVVIPGSMTTIGGQAFSGCSSLTSIIIPSSVTSIGHSAFNDCSSLTSVTIPENVTSIGDYAFAGCTAFRTVEVKMIQPPRISSVTFHSVDLSKVKLIVSGGTVEVYKAAGWGIFGTIEMNANTPTRFVINESGILTQYIGPGGNVVIPNEVKSINNNVFKDNTTITSVVIPGSVTTIGNQAFSGCSNLTSVSMPASVTSIGNETFEGCSSLTSVTIPASVTSIGYQTFEGCSGLTSVNIPDGLTSIESRAFYGCSSLTSVSMPASLTRIDDNTFHGCTALRTVEVKWIQPPPLQTYYVSPNAFGSLDLSKVKLIVPGGAQAAYLSAGLWSNFGTIEMDTSTPHHFIINGSGVLTQYVGLGGNVVIPNEVKSIADNVFKDNTSITSVVIPGSVTSIGSSAFQNCSSLTSVSMPASLTLISGYAFYGCSSLVSITIPISVTSIGIYAFDGCTALRTVEAKMLKPPYLSFDTFDSVDLSKVKLIIPYGTLEVYRAAGWIRGPGQMYVPGFENVEVSADVSTFFAINESGVLTRYIGTGGDIVIPDEGKSIASNVFKDNTTITSVVIPGSVTSIGSQAFYGCSNLTSVTISNGVTSIGSSAFYGCSRLTSVTIPNGVTVLEASTFSGCSGLTSVTIPTSVTSIGAAVFSDCTGLTSVTIPGGVTYIGGGAFYGCTSLRTVEARMMQPPSLFPDTFGSVDLSKVRLIIPGGTVAVYQAAGWNGFGNIEDSGANATLGAPSAANTLRAYAANGLLHVSGLTPGERFYVYDMQGRQVYAGLATATDHSVTLPGGRGIYIVASGGQSVKVIYQLIQ